MPETRRAHICAIHVKTRRLVLNRIRRLESACERSHGSRSKFPGKRSLCAIGSDSSSGRSSLEPVSLRTGPDGAAPGTGVGRRTDIREAGAARPRPAENDAASDSRTVCDDARRRRVASVGCEPCGGYLVDPASSHMLVSKIKPCMSKYKLLQSETANGSLDQLIFLRSYDLLLGQLWQF